MPWNAILSGLATGRQKKEHGMELVERNRKGKHLDGELREQHVYSLEGVAKTGPQMRQA